MPALQLRLATPTPRDPATPPLVVVPPRVVLPLPTGADNPAPVTVVSPPTPPAANLRFTRIPPSVLLSLAAGPVGGVTGSSATEAPSFSERVLVQLPNPAVSEGVLRLVILTQVSGTREESSPPQELPAYESSPPSFPTLIRMLADSITPLMSLREQARDLLFTVGDWWESLRVPTPGTSTFLQLETPEEGSEEGGQLEAAQPSDETVAQISSLGGSTYSAVWAWVPMLSALAIVFIHDGSPDSRKPLRVGLPSKT